MKNILIALLVLAIILPVGIFFLGERKPKRFKNMLAVNIISFFGVMMFAVFFMFSGQALASEVPNAAGAGSAADGLRYLGAALSTGLATIGAGVATGSAAAAALGALSENEGIMGKALIFVALAEGIAIYGMLVSFMILNG
ncbi:MAG: ATP synthase subunit C [Clostridiales bacterium]|jgi:V/A-type H+-transporting ATPase subunit K|nr:ATP synthase subunit C [Clostridiales bacterium]